MSPTSFSAAFERNCPNVRMTDDEREELRRLFFECYKWARSLAIEPPASIK